MLIIKRILTSLINISTFFIISLILYPLLKWVGIELDPKYFLFIAYCATFFIPILYLKTTLGAKLLKLEIDNYRKLLIKHLFYFIIISGSSGSYLAILEGLLKVNLFSNLSGSLLLASVYLTFFIVNNILFFFSGGRYNLIDFLLRLSHGGKKFYRNPYVFLSSWFLVFYMTLITGILIKRNGIYDYFDSLFKPNNEFVVSAYFPPDIFEDFSTFQIVKYSWNNQILTFSDESSFYSDRYLQQKTIFCLIKKSTFENPLKRYKLCAHLKYFSDIDDIFNDHETLADQTRFVLFYDKSQTFFSKKTYRFDYYYDNRKPKYGIYGGVNLDSLSNEYFRSRNLYVQKFNESLSNALNISIDSLNKRTGPDGTMKITDEEDKKLKNYDFSVLQNNDYFRIQIIPFWSTKPDSMFNFQFPYINLYSVQISDNNYFNDKLYKALYIRDLHFYNK